MIKTNVYAFADEAGSSMEEQLVALAENNLDGIELRNIDGENVSDISEEKARDIKQRFDIAGLKVWSLGSPIGKISIYDENFSAHIEKFRHTLNIAEILGAECVRMFSFYIPKGSDPSLYRNEVIDRLGKMTRLAESFNVVVCHENEKDIYGDVASRCLEIHKVLPSVKAVFDPANFIQCGEDTWKAYQLLKPYIKYMHIKDALADGCVVPAGKGIGSVKRITADFLKSGGTDFTVEPHLSVFDGFASLEKNAESIPKGKYIYNSGREAFDAACKEFKGILTEVESQ